MKKRIAITILIMLISTNNVYATKYWASFKDLHITIHVPEGYHIEKNTIAGFERTDNQYNYYSEELPHTNLKFSLDKTSIKKPIMDIALLNGYRMFILIFLASC